MIPQPDFRPTIPGLIAEFTRRFGDVDALVREGRHITFQQQASHQEHW